MSKSEGVCFNKLECLERIIYPNGAIYEHWHDQIDNEHHIHLPDGMFISCRHEDSEGSVEVTMLEKGLVEVER